MPALSRSRRPASGSRYSGSTRGPRTSSSAITGRASRKAAPHQKNSSTIPPRIGPTALPALKAPIQTPMAIVRSRGSLNIAKIRLSVEGASVAPAMPEQRAADDEHLGAGAEGGEDRDGAEPGRTDQEQLAAADAVAERAHRDEPAGDHEAVDVDDPQQLGARRLEVGADGRDREVQDREVHHVEQCAQGEDAQADPFAASGLGGHGSTTGVVVVMSVWLSGDSRCHFDEQSGRNSSVDRTG